MADASLLTTSDVRRLLPEALRRPAQEGARVVALHWLTQLCDARARWQRSSMPTALEPGAAASVPDAYGTEAEALHRARAMQAQGFRYSYDMLGEAALTEVLDRAYKANGSDPITYFEITTVAAIMAFAETPADYTLLEVGLGGRLDATNVIAKPALTIITPVDLDHQQYLGETLAQIAGEKAGIIKRAVPCVVGPQLDEGLEVIERVAARNGAPVYAYGQHYHVSTERGRLIYQDERGLLDLPLPNLPGPHQIQNAGGAVAALRVLGFGEEACEAAVTRAFWPARMQHMKSGHLVDLAKPAELWLDGGHNPHAGRALAETLAALPDRPIHLICGMLNTKDIGGYLRPLAKIAKSLIALSIPGEANTLPAEVTAEEARKAGFEATTAASVDEAITAITAKDPNARILICGSLYLAGHVLRENGA